MLFIPSPTEHFGYLILVFHLCLRRPLFLCPLCLVCHAFFLDSLHILVSSPLCLVCNHYTRPVSPFSSVQTDHKPAGETEDWKRCDLERDHARGRRKRIRGRECGHIMMNWTGRWEQSSHNPLLYQLDRLLTSVEINM